MTCPGCGVENRPGRKFCAECGANLAAVCPACGTANEPGEKFCGECGAALAAAEVAAAPRSTERRLVSVLFADLVGFTTSSEHRDPEDVREMLSHYFERSRTVIERYGGTVEKFIGDAVMAVWGTPVAREDDAERAVRAALGLTNAVAALSEELDAPELRVRAGVLTGRAAVEVGAESEGMVIGDTVNTASRLQALAAPGTVLVDEVTRRASEAAIAYEDAGLQAIRGREEPVHAWIALRVVAGAGGARRGAGIEPVFVGRARELDTVISIAEESAAGRHARLVTVLGAPGIGKSRLHWEFFKYVDGVDDLRWWHEGRSLSYGEGVAYWALAEMIRARAQIVEEEAPAAAREKLRAVVAEHVADERERRLIEPRLAHLLGLEQRTATEAADLFSGWRLFFERMTETGPVVLVFEDVQWADDGLLDFIDYLLEWSAEHPIFVLVLARPELEARRPEWGTVVRLHTLERAAMRSLLGSVAPALPETVTERVIDTADGLPLYAVETVRMLRDRGILTEDGRHYAPSAPQSELEVPETLQALIAARLDNLDASERRLLQDAAVLGTSFSPAAVAAVSGRPEATVQQILDLLVDRQVLGRDDDQRRFGLGQYHFLQALVRTIALDSLPRRVLKSRHLAAADYLQGSAGDIAEIAEVLAGHYLNAVTADPEAVDADAIRDRARETLAAAGHRAVSLALSTEARRFFEHAAELAGDPVERALLLGEAGGAAARAADRSAARTLLEHAIADLDAAGREGDAARIRGQLADVYMADNRLGDAVTILEAAQSTGSDDTVLAGLAAQRARVALLTGDFARALTESDRALEIADPLGLHAILVSAAQTKGASLVERRRGSEALSLLSLGLAVAEEHDLTEETLRASFNVAEIRATRGEIAASRPLLERAITLARERGNRAWERDLIAQRVGIDALSGEWDDALAGSASLHAGGLDESTRLAAVFTPVILAARGRLTELSALSIEPRDASEWHELAVVEAMVGGIASYACGQEAQARSLLLECLPKSDIWGITVAVNLGTVIDALVELGELEALETVVHRRPHVGYRLMVGELLRGRALLELARSRPSEARDAVARAVAELRDAGNPFALGRTLLLQGEILLASGDPAAGADPVRQALDLFDALRAGPWSERARRALVPNGAVVA